MPENATEGLQSEHPQVEASPGRAAAPAVAMEAIEPVADVPLPLEVELDRRTMSVEEILALAPGSVIKMARSAGENIDIRVGGALMGFGEIVILEDTMGVRITDFRRED
jgi:flagellar motor switch protein FliN/FliY